MLLKEELRFIFSGVYEMRANTPRSHSLQCVRFVEKHYAAIRNNKGLLHVVIVYQ